MWGWIASLLGNLSTGTDTSGISSPNLTDEMPNEDLDMQRKKKSGMFGSLLSGAMRKGGSGGSANSGGNVGGVGNTYA